MLICTCVKLRRFMQLLKVWKLKSCLVSSIHYTTRIGYSQTNGIRQLYSIFRRQVHANKMRARQYLSINRNTWLPSITQYFPCDLKPSHENNDRRNTPWQGFYSRYELAVLGKSGNYVNWHSSTRVQHIHLLFSYQYLKKNASARKNSTPSKRTRLKVIQQ